MAEEVNLRNEIIGIIVTILIFLLLLWLLPFTQN